MVNERGSRDGAVVRALAFHRGGSGSILGLDAKSGLSLLLVLFSALRGSSPGMNGHAVEVPLQIPIIIIIINYYYQFHSLLIWKVSVLFPFGGIL